MTTPIDDHLWAELMRRPEAPRAIAARQPRPHSQRQGWSGTEEARADRAAQGFSKLRFRLSAVRPRGRSLVALLGTTAGLLGAAVAAVLLLTAGGTPSVAFAGWSASPTPAPAGQVAEAEASCLARAPEYLKRAERVQKSALEYERNSTEAGVTGTALQRSSSLAATRSSMLSAYEALPAFEAGEWPTVLTDTRGPYTSVIRESSDGQGILSCQSGPLYPGGSGSVSVEVPKSAMPAGEVRLTSEGGEWDTVAKEWLGQVEGRTGTGVTGVTILLQDGTHVEATTTNGWFLAWWPGEQRAVSAEVTTASGVSIEKL